MEASVKMLVYVVNIFMMFVGPTSWGEVTEAGLAEAILSSVKNQRKFKIMLKMLAQKSSTTLHNVMWHLNNISVPGKGNLNNFQVSKVQIPRG